MANTLSNGKELADCLNKIISWLFIGAVFIMWLLLTEYATTKLLVIIASPLLAATFIFGDTCKTLFQGIIYVFVVHPFDVGDLCVIDDIMMEVRSIGVWTTTFTKVDKLGTRKELVIHSNIELASKTIINHKTKFDWSDRVEFNLGRVKMIDIENKNEIINFFLDYLNPDDLFGQKERNDVSSDIKTKNLSYLSRIPNVSVLANEDSITLVIRLEYKDEGTEEWTYSECLWRKDDLKGDFQVYMQDLIRIFKANYAGDQDTDASQLKTENYAIGVQEHSKVMRASSVEAWKTQATASKESSEGWIFGIHNFRHSKILPPAIKAHFKGWKDVLPDGNCGFRCVADAFCGGQDQWAYIRQVAIHELTEEPKKYKLFYKESIEEVIHRIKWFDGGCDKRHYMEAVGDLFLIASHFKCTIFFFGRDRENKSDVSTTIFPLEVEDPNMLLQRELVIAHLGSIPHFFRLELGHGHPIPPICHLWYDHADKKLLEWSEIYHLRREQYSVDDAKSSPNSG